MFSDEHVNNVTTITIKTEGGSELILSETVIARGRLGGGRWGGWEEGSEQQRK